MEKVIGWIFVVIGVLMLLPLISLDIGLVGGWLIMLGFLAIGVLTLLNNKSK